MRDPDWLSSSNGISDFEHELLEAGKNESMPAALREQMERALGLGGAATPGAPVRARVEAATGVKASAMVWISAGVVVLAVVGGMSELRGCAPRVAPVSAARGGAGDRAGVVGAARRAGERGRVFGGERRDAGDRTRGDSSGSGRCRSARCRAHRSRLAFAHRARAAARRGGVALALARAHSVRAAARSRRRAGERVVAVGRGGSGDAGGGPHAGGVERTGRRIHARGSFARRPIDPGSLEGFRSSSVGRPARGDRSHRRRADGVARG